MKKFLLVLMMCLVMFAGLQFGGWGGSAYAADPVLPTEADVVQLFPNAAKIDGKGIYLFGAKSAAIGPSYSIIKVYDLITGDIQFAELMRAGGGSYFGVGASMTFSDLLKKLGKNPPEMILVFDPSLGVTGGLSTTPIDGRKWDGGISFKIMHVDTAKLLTWVGL